MARAPLGERADSQGRARVRAAVVGVAGPVLLDEEAALFRAVPPAGAILR